LEFVFETNAKLAFCAAGGGVMFGAIVPLPHPASANINKLAAALPNRAFLLREL
jgi:hypothetical protein